MVGKEIVIVDEKALGKKVIGFKRKGSSGIHILADFDRTLTYGLDKDGRNRTPTVVSQLRSDEKYLGRAYKEEAERLFDLYHPIEINPNIPLDEKRQKMHEWWSKHFDWIAKNGLTKKIIEQVVKERPLRFRKGALEFMEMLNEHEIPLVIMSAAPGDMLAEYLEQNGLMFPNVYIISNRYKFNSQGKAIAIQEPIIHTFNKTEVSLEEYPIYSHIRNRRNVLLLGDSVGDIGMVEGFPYSHLIKIGFLNEEVEQSLPSFKKSYDVVLLGDQDFGYVNSLLGGILK